MARNPRKKSEKGIYHIILRGTNRQEIFHDDEDCLRFIETVDKYKNECKLEVFGWCLMGNHVHLLLKEGCEYISETMKRIGISYAWFYNFKYGSTGHLFQDRFRSEIVDTDEYLMTVIRYIHRNPIKAGIARATLDWKWSSCHGYYGQKCYPARLLDLNFVLDMFSQDIDKAKKKFKEYDEIDCENKCIDENIKPRLTDEQAKMEIRKIIPIYEIAIIKSMAKQKREDILNKVMRIEGLTQRQAGRILGVSQSLIYRAVCESKEPSL
jgi:putative transposase